MPPPSLGSSTPLVPPLYQSSVYTLADLDALDRIMTGSEPGFIYARDAHPNASAVAEHLAHLERAHWGIVCGSGMAALSVALLGFVNTRDRIVASNRLYGRTATLLRQELRRFGVETVFVDANDLNEVRSALAQPARLLLVETISNPLLRVADIPALAELCKAAGTRLLVDNTFATPVLCRPMELGADLVMESLTKMIGGHSDITLGVLCGNDPDLAPTLRQIMSVWGLASNPFDCWLAERGLCTLELRMRTATTNAAALADWLPNHPGITRVLYPTRADHSDHALASRLLPHGVGNVLCFELAGDGREAVNRFMRRSTGIPFSPSLGNTTTTCSHPATTSHRYESPAEKKRQGITDGLIRLSVGIEPLEQIKEELAKGLVA